MAINRNDDIRVALDVCSTWVTDASGDRRKDCISCPYQDPADPIGLDCGEKLMKDAGKLTDQQKARIDELEGQIRKMSKELARVSQREYNG